MKNCKQYGIFIIVCMMGMHTVAQPRNYTLASPNGKIVSHIVADKGKLTYDLNVDGNTILLESPIALDRTCGTTHYRKMEVIASPERGSFNKHLESNSYTMNKLTLSLEGGLKIDFQVCNEGLAYRFRTEQACIVNKEVVVYNFAHNYRATVPYVRWSKNQFMSSFENTYTTATLSELDKRRLAFLPLLVYADQGTRIAISECYQQHYPGLYLKGTGKAGQLRGAHAPYPDQIIQGGHNNLQGIVKSSHPWIAQLQAFDTMPWRMMMVAQSDAELAGNNLTSLLAPPCRLSDTDWIKPGKVAWDWWNCWNINGVDFKSGVNNDTYKYYIDFASQYGIEYVILDEGWAVNLKADLFQVVPEIDLPMLVEYANQRGVGLILWAGYYAFARDMEQVCKHYSAMGIKGFKVDFMDRDDQIINEFYYHTAAICAQYHLLVDFHGAHIPAGIDKVYPNVINFEGVYGLENMKWAPAEVDQMEYDVLIPFIRQLGGPMDYTPGAMRNAAKHCYYPCWSEPMSQGTRCHQLALYLVLDQPLAMLCDSPTEYMLDPEYTSFLTAIPTTWDETRVLQGEIGLYIVTARRKGTTWYIGGITNWTERDIEIDLSKFASSKNIVLYKDGINAHRKGNDYKVEQPQFSNTLSIHMAPGGGFAMKIEP